jgi:hypothetical protein
VYIDFFLEELIMNVLLLKRKFCRKSAAVLLILVFMMALVPTAGADVIYHCSARVSDGSNFVFLFNADGVYTGQSYLQIPQAQDDYYGYRDGASDGRYVYFGWEDGVARHDPDGSNGILLFPNNTGLAAIRGLAYDPTGDNGNGSFWTANFGGNLVEVDMAGNVLNTYPQDSAWALYGLAYDPNDGNLWVHNTGADVNKVDTSTGLIIPGAGWASPVGFVSQGGLSGMHDGSGEVAAVWQMTPDQLGVTEDNGTVVGGPWDMSGQTGSIYHLGVAVIDLVNVYCEDFEKGLNGFTIDNGYGDANGLWNLTTLCRSATGDHSTMTSLYYGNDANCNYNEGLTEGVVTSPAISLKGVSGPKNLLFNYTLGTEGTPAFFDKASVEVSDNGRPFTLVAHNDPCLSVYTLIEDPNWHAAIIDLSWMSGPYINVRFHFKTVDSFANSYAGFYADDVKITGVVKRLSNPNPYNGNLTVPVGTNLAWNSCIVVPNDRIDAEGSSNNAFPFNNKSDPSMRYQQIYDSAEVGQSGVISQIRFRPDASGNAFSDTDMNVEIYLGYSANPVGAPSSTFANNIGPGYTKVYDGILTIASADLGGPPRNFDIVVDVNDAFAYNPASGPLLLDVKMNDSPSTTQFDAHNSASVSRIYSASSVAEPTGTVDSGYGLVTMFCFDGAIPSPGAQINTLDAEPDIQSQQQNVDNEGGIEGELPVGVTSGSSGANVSNSSVNSATAENSAAILSNVSSSASAEPVIGDEGSIMNVPAVSHTEKQAEPVKLVEVIDTDGTSSAGPGTFTKISSVGIASPGASILVLETSRALTGSVLDILDNMGIAYDYNTTDDFIGVDFSPYSTIIVGMDGGYVDQNDVELLAMAASEGRKLILLGGTAYSPYVLGLSNYIIDVNTTTYYWTTVSGSPDMTVTQPGHPLAAGLPATYDFVNSSATFYMARIEDPAANIIAENGDGWPCLVTKPVGAGQLIYFINSPYESYWTDPNDYAILQTILQNALGQVCGCLDLGDPTSAPFLSSNIGTNDRAVAVDINRTVKVSSLDILVEIGVDTNLTVTIRDVNGTTLGAVLASATVPVWKGGPGFYSVPIDFTFQKGMRYDIAFNVTGGWGGSVHNIEFYNFDNPTLNPALGYDVGPFKVLDGRGSTGGYSNFVMPHIRACMRSATYDVYFGSNGEPLELLASGLPQKYVDPVPGPDVLDFGTDYYWQVVAKSCCGDKSYGPVWKFKTEPECWYCPYWVLGDINGDGYVSANDVGPIINNFGKPASVWPCADVNMDGWINANDVGPIINNFGSGDGVACPPLP